MLTFWGRGHDYCDGLNRRAFLRLGALGLGGLTLADLLRHEAQAGQPGRAKSVIYVVLGGGPSHIDMYDLKPDAPAEYRGPFKPIATRLTGVRHLRADAAAGRSIMDQLALLRGIRSVENDHFLSEVYTGLPRTAGKRPAFGSVVSRLAGSGSSLPAYVSLNRATTDEFEYEKPYYAGAGHAPVPPVRRRAGRPEAGSLARPTERPPALLAAFDTLRRDLDRPGTLARSRPLPGPGAGHHHVATSPRRLRPVQGAGPGAGQLRPRQVSAPDRQGHLLRLGRAAVLAGPAAGGGGGARGHAAGRLLGPPQQRAGDIFHCLRHLLPALDRSLYALFHDLRMRGLDDDVLVVVLGEFGRTPKISDPGPGREHWADAGCACSSAAACAWAR